MNIKLNLVLGTICFIIMVVLLGCTQRASKINPEIINDLSGKLIYFKDAKGICYATVASRHPFDTDQNGFTITYVPCTPEVEAAIGK